jgi:hypothetical protein
LTGGKRVSLRRQCFGKREAMPWSFGLYLPYVADGYLG